MSQLLHCKGLKILLCNNQQLNYNKGNTQITTEPQQREENLTQQCHDMPTFVANETMTQGEVDVYDASLGDVMVGEDWREGLLNDEQLNSLYLGDWNDDALDFSDFKW
ncbi:hypothetical protein ACLB2K_052961 [Fragaria x ananassa]